MPAQMQGVLVAFRLVFVFETVVTELASVLFLHFMRPQLFFAFKFLWLFRAALAHKLACNARGIAMPVLING
jgi:hypothetical protein